VAVVAILATSIVAPPAAASCQYCGGHFTNLSCKDVHSGRTNGYEECATNTTGQCIASGASCTWNDCTNKIECGPFEDGRIELPEIPFGETLVLDRDPVCRLPGLVIEA
jgi:hypothetical protein